MDNLLSRLLWLFVGIVLGAIFHESVLKQPPTESFSSWNMIIDLNKDTIYFQRIK